MIVFVLILILVLMTIYAFNSNNLEFTTTASAIREIWTGNCRLSCRQGGLGTDGPSNDCVCDSCPCTLVDDILRTCRPATYFYNQCIEWLSSCHYEAVKALSNNLKSVDRITDNSGSSQRQAQLIAPLDSSDININFINNTAVKTEGDKTKSQPEITEKGASNLSSLSRLKLAIHRKSNADMLKKGKESTAPESQPATQPTAKASECCSESDFSNTSQQPRKNCPKCIEKGKTCIGACPKANEQENKK